MKRDKNLETLSWEHHDGLVLAFRIEKGLNNQTDIQTIKDYLLYLWHNVLIHHFWQEEQVLIEPIMQDREGIDLINQMHEDHRYFESIVHQFEHQYVDHDSLSAFAERLNHHIRFEERQLFPYLERRLPKHKLDEIGSFLHKHHEAVDKEWGPHFWKA